MASVIASARQSTSSVFDVVTRSAEATSQLLTTGILGIDMLTAKARLMHDRVTINAKAQAAGIKQEEIMRAADQHADFLAEIQRKNYSDPSRQQIFEAALTEIQSAFDAA